MTTCHQNQPGVEDRDVPEQTTAGLSASGGKKDGREKTARHSKVATTRAWSRTASRKAVVVISAISKKVGIVPKNSRWFPFAKSLFTGSEKAAIPDPRAPSGKARLPACWPPHLTPRIVMCNKDAARETSFQRAEPGSIWVIGSSLGPQDHLSRLERGDGRQSHRRTRYGVMAATRAAGRKDADRGSSGSDAAERRQRSGGPGPAAGAQARRWRVGQREFVFPPTPATKCPPRISPRASIRR